jgi:hypothetical protein
LQSTHIHVSDDDDDDDDDDDEDDDDAGVSLELPPLMLLSTMNGVREGPVVQTEDRDISHRLLLYLSISTSEPRVVFDSGFDSDRASGFGFGLGLGFVRALPGITNGLFITCPDEVSLDERLRTDGGLLPHTSQLVLWRAYVNKRWSIRGTLGSYAGSNFTLRKNL